MRRENGKEIGAGAGAEAEATEMWQGVFGFEKVPKKMFTINRRLCFNTLFMRNFNGKREKEGVIEQGWVVMLRAGETNKIMKLKCAFCFGELSQLDTRKYKAIKTIMKSKE